jgi:hypothetical protein
MVASPSMVMMMSSQLEGLPTGPVVASPTVAMMMSSQADIEESKREEENLFDDQTESIHKQACDTVVSPSMVMMMSSQVEGLPTGPFPATAGMGWEDRAGTGMITSIMMDFKRHSSTSNKTAPFACSLTLVKVDLASHAEAIFCTENILHDNK